MSLHWIAATVLQLVGPGQDIGPAHIVLRGDYVGKEISITSGDTLIDQRRFTFPPPGAEDRFTVVFGPPQTVELRIAVEGCAGVWQRPVQVAPNRSASLIFRGCAIEALPPE